LHPLTDTFDRFGRFECAGWSPLYERLSALVAGDEDLLDLASRAQERQPPPNLLFGAVHLLLGRDRSAPLREWYEDLASGPVRRDDPTSAFRGFCLDRRAEIAALLGSRRVQTNEVQRCLLLLPAFGIVRRESGRPLALIEVGTSAGLLLHFDRYHYAYRTEEREVACGNPRSDVRLRTRLEGGRIPPLDPALPDAPWRTGIDLRPLDPAAAEDREWLLALVWPEHHERRRHLAAALAVAAGAPLPVRTGDAGALLPAALADAPSDAAPVVLHMSVLRHMSEASRRAMDEALVAASSRRDVWRVGNDLFPAVENRWPVNLCRYRGGVREDRILADAPGHVQWLHWR
jgi:hypothetical protein